MIYGENNLAIKDNFLYCESHTKERAIDLNRVCDPIAMYKSPTNVWLKKSKKLTEAFVMSKSNNQVDGFGYQCEQLEYEYQYSKTLIGHETETRSEIAVKLGREECLEMARTRTCMGMPMNCSSEDECSMEHHPEATYNRFYTNTKYGHKCSFSSEK